MPLPCTCIPDTVKMVTDQLVEATPGAERFHMHLGINLETGKAFRSFFVDISGHYMAPKKTEGFKRVNKTVSVAANYCPFCGKRSEP